jgi:hypothetical protein
MNSIWFNVQLNSLKINDDDAIINWRKKLLNLKNNQFFRFFWFVFYDNFSWSSQIFWWYLVLLLFKYYINSNQFIACEFCEVIVSRLFFLI